MWYWWTKVERADIPTALRAELESLGEQVVAHIVALPLTHSPAQTVGVPGWAGDPADRQRALAWLREQYTKRDRREDVREAIEVAILVLVAIEALPILVRCMD